jgi:hypothetical protein
MSGSRNLSIIAHTLLTTQKLFLFAKKEKNFNLLFFKYLLIFLSWKYFLFNQLIIKLKN